MDRLLVGAAIVSTALLAGVSVPCAVQAPVQAAAERAWGVVERYAPVDAIKASVQAVARIVIAERDGAVHVVVVERA